MRTNRLSAQELQQNHGMAPGVAVIVEQAVEAELNHDDGVTDGPFVHVGPFTGKGSRARKAAALEEVQALALKVIAEQKPMAFGHGYLWGVVAGVRGIIGVIDGREGHNEIERRVRQHPAVTSTWINLD